MRSKLARLVTVTWGGALNLALLCAPLIFTGRVERVWQDFSLALFLVLATALYLADAQTIWLGAEDSKSGSPADQRHRQLALASGLCLLSLFWLAAIERRFSAASGLNSWSMVCATIAAAGVALRGIAVQMLGRHFVSSIAIAGKRRLICHGIYAWVRHPSETGLLLFAFGVAGLLQSIAGVVAAIVLLGLVAARVRQEDAQLVLAFGVAFRRYRRRVPGFVPYFRGPTLRGPSCTLLGMAAHPKRSRSDAGTPYASSPRTTLPCTSVRR